MTEFTHVAVLPYFSNGIEMKFIIPSLLLCCIYAAFCQCWSKHMDNWLGGDPYGTLDSIWSFSIKFR